MLDNTLLYGVDTRIYQQENPIQGSFVIPQGSLIYVLVVNDTRRREMLSLALLSWNEGEHRGGSRRLLAGAWRALDGNGLGCFY